MEQLVAKVARTSIDSCSGPILDTTTKSYAEGDVLASIENVTGSRGADVIMGDEVPNVIKGGGGNDTLSGAGQNDKLHGGAGNDTLGARPAIAADDLNGDSDHRR